MLMSSVQAAEQLGQTYTFLLEVVSFLGFKSAAYSITVTRAQIPIPTITISAPPVLAFPS